jgi:hypothetical protein
MPERVRGQVAACARGSRPAADRLDDGGVRVAEQVDRDAAEQVDVLAAVDVPDDGAAARGEHDRAGCRSCP